MLVVPHDLSQSNQVNLKNLCESFGSSTVVVKDYHSDIVSAAEDVVILTQLGILAELYRHSELAFVGGACHHKVHNILEPAFFGRPVAFGPRYHNHPEARLFVQHELVTVIENAVYRLVFIQGKSTLPRQNITRASKQTYWGIN